MVDPSSLSARCTCGCDLWAVRNGQWTLLSRIVRLGDAGLEAKCPECQATVPLPWLALQPSPDEGSPAARGERIQAGDRIIIRRSRTVTSGIG